MSNLKKILYQYQEEIIKLLENFNKGIIVLPTGTGKTFIQAAYLTSMIRKNNGKFGIYVINAPRILLSYQLLKEVYKFLTSNFFGLHIEARYMGVHSGRLDGSDEDFEIIRQETDIPYAEIHSSTSSSEIREMIKTAKKQDLPLILFSTYHSGTRIEDARKGLVKEVNLILNDEAHYLVTNQFHDNIEAIKYKKQFFFTATTRSTISDDGFGMNNKELFGTVIKEMTPRQAIELGKMIRPRLHFIKTDKNITKENLDQNIGKLINDAFKGHQFILDGLAPKMMITINDSVDMVNFLKSPEYQKMVNVGGVKVYMVHSNEVIGNMINGVHTTREKWLKSLKEDGNNIHQKLIVMHYQIITEGLDVPGLTGVMLLRSLKKSNFVQTFGRVARPTVIDKLKLNSGEIKPHELEKLIKPYAYIILPSIIADDTDKIEYLSSLIYSLREFDFKPDEDIIITDSNAGGIPEPLEGPDGLRDIELNLPVIGDALEKLTNEYEDEQFASLKTLKEKLSLVKKIFI